MLTHNQILSLCQTQKQRLSQAQNPNMEVVLLAITQWLAKASGIPHYSKYTVMYIVYFNIDIIGYILVTLQYLISGPTTQNSQHAD